MKRKTLLISGAIIAAIAIIAGGILLINNWHQAAYKEGKTTTTANGTTFAQSTGPVPTQSGTVDGMIGSEIAKPFELVPVDMDANGTGIDSAYHIILKENQYNADELSSKISISPEAAFNIDKKAENDFILTPTASLSPNKVYSFAFSDEEKGVSYSWAFQTRKAFNITGTLPGDQATHVPVTTGIEITFSQKDLSDLSGFFEISPQVTGRFEIHKNVIAFVPSSRLAYDTIYTVTVKKGFGNNSNDMKLQEETIFVFQTEPEPEKLNYSYSCNSLEFVRNMYNLYPSEIPNISIYSNITGSTEVEFSLYKYNTADEFKNDISVRDDRPYWCRSYGKQPDIEGKEQVLNIKTTLKSFDEGNDNYYYRTRYIVLPEALPEGYYIAVVKTDELERRAYIQVNSMAVYVGTSVNRTIALIYDSGSALPVEGAKIVFDDFTIQTGADGLAVSNAAAFDSQGYHTKNYEIVRAGHPTYFSSVSGSNYQENIRDKYWSYLFTDREMYLPSDTINIWGLVTGRDSGTAPAGLTVKLSSGYVYDYYDYYSYNAYREIDSKDVTLTGPDTFQTSMTFENLNEGYYSLRVYSGEEVILSKGIRIEKYTKPLYSIKTSLDKKIVFENEKLEFNMEAGFFEGTPVNGMKFNYYIGSYYASSQSQSGVLKTDAGGRAKLEFSPNRYDSKTWYPYSMSIYVSNADPEESPINEYEWFTVFPRDTMVKYSSETDEDDKCTVTLNTNKIDINKIRGRAWYSEEDYTGEKCDIDMTVELYEEYYTATKIGTYYDFINKITYPRYRYDRHTNKIRTLQLHSLDGTAAFSFTKEEGKGYYFKMSCNDGNGKPIEQTFFVYSPSYRDENTSWLKLDYYSLAGDKDFYSGYSADEKVNVTLHRNSEPCLKQDNAKVLFMRFRKGMLDYTLTDETTYSFDFKKEYVPNVCAMAVYFDGKSMHQTYIETIRYKKEDRSLNIEVIPSSSEYKPGGTASFNLKVTDNSGKGRRAQVLFSVVDEAYFAVYNQSVDILYSVYSSSVSSGYTGGSIPYTNTLKDYNYYGGAECGEGGDDVTPTVRSDFKDTAIFKTIMTDENGRGEMSFTLPDNLTKWRVTCLGLTDDLCAGNQVINIDTRLPYFINTVFSEVFITGDKPVLQVRSFGTSIVEGEKVDYTVEIRKDGALLKKYAISSTIGDRAYIELDRLEEGTYSYTATGKYGSYGDAVMYEFEVLPGFVEQPVTKYDALTDNIELPKIKYPAQVYFFNSNVKSYWQDLIDLSHSWGERIDCIIVRKHAKALLSEYFESTWGSYSREYDVKKYQLANGGIALLPYDSPNPVLTAKICSLSDSDFDYTTMKEYFNRIISANNSTSTDVAASYWGLASMREPVLLELNELVKSEGLPVVDRLYIALAYAYIGDLDKAGAIYSDIANKYLKEDSLRAYILVENENYDSDDIQEATSLCALLASKVNAPAKQKLFEYVSNMYATDILTNAMRLSLIKSDLKTLNMLSSFTYELDGKKEEIRIEGKDTFKMLLTAKKLSEIKFSDIKGDITVATVYKTMAGEMSETDERLTISRSYVGDNEKAGTNFDASEYVKVVLKIRFADTAPTGVYMVEDYLPASLRYVSGYTKANNRLVDRYARWYPHEILGPKVSFYIYHHNKDNRERTIEYFARVSGLGEFTADSAAVFNLESNVTAYTPRAVIKIK